MGDLPVCGQGAAMSENTTGEAQAPKRPRRMVRTGGQARPLPAHARALDDLRFETPGGAQGDVAGFMARRATMGLLILKDGEIALERYGPGHGPERRWHGFSTAKSLTATLAGAALHDGAIENLDEPCERYLPQLRGSSYDGVTVRNLLRMCSGVGWRENNFPADQSEIWRLNAAVEERRVGSVLDLARALPRAHPQGEVFNYSTVETCVLGAVIAAATGVPLADYCAERVWGPAGMEADAVWALEADGGLEMGGFGVSARLRDLGRFGLFVLEDGAPFGGGARRLPEGWRGLAGQPDCAATGFGRLFPGDPGGYGYQWWAVPPLPGGINNGAFSARGAFGQFIFINPAEQVIVVIQSAWSTSDDLEAGAETVALIRAAVRALQ